MNLDAVRRLVADLDEVALQLVGKRGEIDELLAAGAGIGPQAGGRGMLLRIGRIEGVKRGGKDRVAGDVIAPVVERDAPGVRAGIACQSWSAGACRG